MLVMTLVVLGCMSAKDATVGPAKNVKAPKGFSVKVWAVAPNARSMVWGDKGTLFVGTKAKGVVYAVRDTNGDGVPEVKEIITGLEEPTGLAFKDGALYVAEIPTLYRYDAIESHLDDKKQVAVKVASFPKEGHHGWREIAFGPDKKLYVAIGAPCNVCEVDAEHGIIFRMNADGSARETVASGVRNSVGVAWHPTTGKLFFTENGRDMLGDDIPADELNVVTKAKEHFGFPACHQGDTFDPDFAKGHACSEFTAPIVKLDPHAAALGLTFYTASAFGADFKNDLFIAEHGSWNRSKKSGYQVVRVKVDGEKVTKIEPFLTGFLEGEKTLGRPVDVLVDPQGALLVSDDETGAIYRVTKD